MADESEFLTMAEEHFHILPFGEESQGFGKILSTDTSLRILKEIYESDPKVGLSSQQVSTLLGVGRTTVIYHLNRMLETGLIKLHPALIDNHSWDTFWNLFRNRDADVTNPQFEEIHKAHINGVKLFIPAKKGILILPTTDPHESKTLFNDMFTSISKKTVKRGTPAISSALGILGILFITLSLISPQPQIYQALQSSPTLSVPDQAMDQVGRSEKALMAEEGSPGTRPSPPPAPDRPLPISQGLLYLGLILSGSAIGIYIYNRKAI